MIKYLGSKRALMDGLLAAIQKELPNGGHVLDLFSGTSRVGYALKEAGFQVTSNDHNTYAHTLATCYVQADLEDHTAKVEALLKEFNLLPGTEGWFTETYCRESRYFQAKNGARIEAIRNAIEEGDFPFEQKSILLTSLLEAADRVDSTTGIQMAYLKQWAARSKQDLNLRVPQMLSQPKAGRCQALQLEAEAAAREPVDLAYLDPPYNQHSYLGNYHIWESLVRWDQPEVYGIAKKRIDCRERKSPFNSKVKFRSAFQEVLKNLNAPRILVSFSDEAFLSLDEMLEVLNPFGEVQVHDRPHERYVGAKIGIHGRTGERVGEVTHTKNTEYLFVVRR